VAAANNLPVPLTRIVGRDEIIAVLSTALPSRRSRLRNLPLA
jgi:hypothetical protein